MIKRFCKGCGEQIHPKRIEILPETQTCVVCSNTGKLRARILTLGEGDHTYNEVEFVTPETYERLYELQYGRALPKEDLPEIQDYDTAAVADQHDRLQAQTDKYLDEEEETQSIWDAALNSGADEEDDDSEE